MAEDEAEGGDEEKVKIPLKAEDVMAREVVTVDEDVSVKQAAEIMAQQGISSVIVTSGGKATGILTERDILRRIVVEDRNSKKTKLKDIMSSPLIIIEPSVDLEQASRLMFDKKIKNLPVIENNRLVGLVSLTDICRLQPEILKILRQNMETPENIKKVLSCYII